MEFWLVRHGRTSAVEEGRFQGRCDFHLNEEGSREAARLSLRLSIIGGFELFLSSDLQRAWLTAEIISRGIKLAPLREPLLRECSWGYIEGMRRSEVETAYPFLFHSGSGILRALRCGGESERKLLARTRTLRRKICRGNPGLQRILLVGSHGRRSMPSSPDVWDSPQAKWPYAPAPASLSIVKCDPGGEGGRLLLFNDISHLQD